MAVGLITLIAGIAAGTGPASGGPAATGPASHASADR